MSQDLEKFGMPEEELFAPVDHSDLESEKITAPRYSYWHSVFRVFFKKKINIIILGLIYGSNSKAKIDDILKVTNNIARKTLYRYCGEENSVVDLPEIKLNQPEYTEAFINMIFRIMEQPLSYFDILRFLDFTLFQYDLEYREYDISELNILFKNVEALKQSAKTFLRFVCYITNMPKEIFILLKDNEKNI